MSPFVSWLYVPGDRPERFDKAVSSGASVVIIDLEDAVEMSRKDQARTNAVSYLSSARGRTEVHVRINDLASARGLADLQSLVGLPGLSALRVPKVESTAVLDSVDEAFAGQHMPVYALIESAQGLAELASIARHHRVAGIALGEQDLIAELNITAPTAIDQIRLQAVLAASAAGLPPVPMSVFTNIQDEPGLLASCKHGRGLGMFGRSAIHPRQIPLIAQAFRPTEEEITWATAVNEATLNPSTEHPGSFALPDGQFVDAPIITRARRILDLAGTAHSAAAGTA
jgi:citrate lyase subunit beta / citryl-CoA lyase